MKPRHPVYVIGAGGHGKVVIATLEAAGYAVQGVFDDDAEKQGKSVLGVPVLGRVGDLPESGLVPAVIALGRNSIRKRIVTAAKRMKWATAVHPTALVHPSVALGPGTIVLAGAVVQPETIVGEHVILNTGATVDHDCRLGDFCHVAPGAHLAGEVFVGEGTLLGIGCAVVPGAHIGAWSVVGAGASVVTDIPAKATAVGVPAKLLPPNDLKTADQTRQRQ